LEGRKEKEGIVSSLPLLACSVPYLSFDELFSNLDVPVSKFYPYCGFEILPEYIFCKSRFDFPISDSPIRTTLEESHTLVFSRMEVQLEAYLLALWNRAAQRESVVTLEQETEGGV